MIMNQIMLNVVKKAVTKIMLTPFRSMTNTFCIDIMVKQTKSSKTIKAKTLKPGCVPYKKKKTLKSNEIFPQQIFNAC